MQSNERSELAVFIDFENLVLGLKGRRDQVFDIHKVMERLLEKGNIIVKRAYADWSRFTSYSRSFHEVAIELTEIPKRQSTGKNSADIRLAVDAMDLCYAKEHIDTFVILSGDSDFSPLVSKLRENGKRVIGLALRGSTSDLLVSNCDEFIFYESIQPPRAKSEGLPEDKEGILTLVTDTVTALLREGRDPIQASLIKDTIKRKQPSFTEADYGYRSFTELMEDAQDRDLISLSSDPRSGTYLVTLGKPVVKSRPRTRRATSSRRRPAAKPEANGNVDTGETTDDAEVADDSQ